MQWRTAGPRLARRENGWCVYLTDDKRCGIYPTRPKVCQEYDCRFLDILTAGAAAVGLVGITLKYADTVEADPYPDWKLRVETPEDRTVLVAYGNVAATPLVAGIVRNPASVVRHPEWDALVAAATSAKETRK